MRGNIEVECEGFRFRRDRGGGKEHKVSMATGKDLDPDGEGDQR